MRMTLNDASEFAEAILWARDLADHCGGAACVVKNFDRWVAMPACQTTGTEVTCVVNDGCFAACLSCSRATPEHRKRVRQKAKELQKQLDELPQPKLKVV